MARIPGLIWRPLPENATQPSIRPTQWILHTAVDGPGPTDLGGYFHRADITLESHTWLRWDRHEQLMDTEVRADANYLANRRPDGSGAISTETEDDGSPVQRPWNDYQVTELIRTGVELNRLHGIPPVLPASWAAPGMGYHSLYPQHWTNVPGKTCPGSTRINQFKNIVLPGIQAALKEEEDMAAQIVWYKEANGRGHAYQVNGLHGKYLTPEGLKLATALGVKAVNTPSTAFDAVWQSTAILVDGPLANVAPPSGATAASIAAEFAKRLAA